MQYPNELRRLCQRNNHHKTVCRLSDMHLPQSTTSQVLRPRKVGVERTLDRQGITPTNRLCHLLSDTNSNRSRL